MVNGQNLTESRFAQLNGSWQNELNSQLIIDSISTDGQIFGLYKSSSGVDGRIFKMDGKVNQHPDSKVIAISFTVKWDDYGSITSWTGYVDVDYEANLYMKTLWHLVRPQNAEPWERIITNSSEFRLVSLTD